MSACAARRSGRWRAGWSSPTGGHGRGRGDDGGRLRSAVQRIGPGRQRPSLLAGELEAGGQVLALDRVRQEQEAGRRHEAERRSAPARPRSDCCDRGEVIGPDAAAVHDRHDVLRLRARRRPRWRRGQRHLHRYSASTEGLAVSSEASPNWTVTIGDLRVELGTPS